MTLLDPGLTRAWVLGPALLLALATAQEPDEPRSPHSLLWGAEGELWTPEGRLPDFSFAGYRRGEGDLPRRAATHDARELGAKGDGETDDSAALQRAIAAGGVIELPPGRYLVTEPLAIERSGVVLRGAGPGLTTLVFPRTLTDIEPRWTTNTGGRRTSSYSWSGGWIRVQGRDGGRTLGAVVEPAARGARELALSGDAEVSVGDELRLVVSDDEEQSLAHYAYAGDPGDIRNLGQAIRLGQVFRVLAVEEGRIRLDRPLRFDVRPAWQPQLLRFEPTVTEVGIEDLTLEFPATPYQGHFTELGHNGIALAGVAHCWVRNVRLVNAESGIFLGGRFNTLSDIRIESERAPDARGHRGHHALTLGGEDNLLRGFWIEARYIHDITLTRGSIGNVAAAGRGVDLCLDHHRRGPYENLFTDIDLGRGTRPWASGGGQALGRHCAAGGTFWNLRSERALAPPPRAFAPDRIQLVGLATDRASILEPEGPWFEAIPPGALFPPDLHLAQLERRLR